MLDIVADPRSVGLDAEAGILKLEPQIPAIEVCIAANQEAKALEYIKKLPLVFLRVHYFCAIKRFETAVNNVLESASVSLEIRENLIDYVRARSDAKTNARIADMLTAEAHKSTWEYAAGRDDGDVGYHFGDLTRSVVRGVKKSKARDARSSEANTGVP